MNDDLDLKRAFEILREEDRAALPGFGSVANGRRRARERRSDSPARLGVAWATVLGTAATVAAVVLLRPSPDAYSLDDAIAMAASVSAWTAPTDGFLEIDLPGTSLGDSFTSLELTSLALPEIRTSEDVGSPTHEP